MQYQETSAEGAEERASAPAKCQHGPCACPRRNGSCFCSSYCEQADSQAVERDYCQCEHELTPRTVTLFAEANRI
jgi:hypothetical protein